jgi:hypothetical protein
MRFFAAFGVICAVSSQTALAETQDCKTITDPPLRLTCYDKINPPIATYPVPLAKPSHPIPTTRLDGTAYVDPQDDEDALVRAQMSNICRGC